MEFTCLVFGFDGHPSRLIGAGENPRWLRPPPGRPTKSREVMKKQGQDSEAKLKELFKTDFQAGVKRHKALLAQQKAGAR